MIATGSNLNDLMYDFYQTLNSRNAGTKLYGPVQIASALSTLNQLSAEHVFPFPEKTMFSSVYYVTSAAITAGTISLELSFMAGFTGTWHVLESKTFVGTSDATCSISQFTNGPYVVMRCRVTAAIVGGTVDVFFLGT